jgi:NADH-quinone oxidoreductase subunit L
VIIEEPSIWPLVAMIGLPLLCALLVVTTRDAAAAARVAITGSGATWLVALIAAAGQLGADPARAAAWGSGDGLLGVSFALSFDALAAAMVLLATTVGLLVQVYSSAYLAGDPRYRSYAALVALFGAAMNTVVLADDLVVLLIGWEVMGVCSYLLISHHWELPAARDGAAKAFVMTRFADLGLLVAIIVLAVDVGSLRISDVLVALDSGALDDGTVTAVALLLVLAVVGKSAQFPLHTWLPDAMPGPTPVSALIHAATMVAAGVYLLARMLPLIAASDVATAVLGLVACATMLIGAAFALTAADVKRALAWSTVSQLAYMFAALAVGSWLAATGHLLVHGAFKALLFLGAGCLAHAVGSTAIAAMGGLRRDLPWTFWSMTAGLAALVGLVPTAGFFSKDAVLGAALDATHGQGQVWLAWTVLVCGLGAAVLTAAYATRLWLLVFFGERSDGPAVHEAPPAMRWPVALLVVPTLLLGPAVLAPGWLGAEAEPFHWSIAVLTTALVLLTALLVRALWDGGADPSARLGRLRPLLVRELGVDAGWDRAVVRPVRGTSRLALAGDTDVVDAYVRGTGWVADGMSRLLGLAQTRNAVTYVGVAVVGVAAAGIVVGLLG